MKTGYTLPERDTWSESRSSLSSNLSPATAEGVLLFIIALAGGLGNISVMIVTIMRPALRHMSSAFLFHHCLLDAIKSAFCIPFGYSLIYRSNIPRCDVIGACYILLMTVSAYNLLALLVNEEYQCSFSSRKRHHKSDDSCCIAFGVAIIWFTTVLLHLGVIFLPGSSEFSKDVGNCVYRHGVTKNYVIHTLWIILVTVAIAGSAISFSSFFRKLKSSNTSRKWSFLHKSLSSLSPHSSKIFDQNEEVLYEFDNISSQKAIQQARIYLRRITIMMAMIVSFVVCWYPLFVLTLLDIHYQQPPHVYRLLMILAWAHPVTTPIFCGLIYHGTVLGQRVTKDVYTNAIPLMASRSRETIPDTNHMRPERTGTASHVENCQGTVNHTGLATSNRHLRDQCDISTCNAVDHFDTIINYNAEEDRYQTLIM